jgi:cobalt/nickel transport system permease protein
LYRYIFVLAEEAMRIVRARDMRSFGRNGTDVKVFIRIAGVLFLRTVERAERIYYAMLARGFQGDMPTSRRYHIATRDLIFAGSVGVYLFVFRFYPVSETLGRFFQELFL